MGKNVKDPLEQLGADLQYQKHQDSNVQGVDERQEQQLEEMEHQSIS
jgi:hypothetical protein